jgi:hypothetical protein
MESTHLMLFQCFDHAWAQREAGGNAARLLGLPAKV